MSATVIPPGHPRLEKIILFQDLARKHKPNKPQPDFTFAEPLKHGWMLPYLLSLDDMLWGRWNHWSDTLIAEKILPEQIPQIVWCGQRDSIARKEIERSLNTVTKHGEWAGWSSWTYFDYFLDWLLYGFGDPKQQEEPKPPGGCEGASERLYQVFNLGPLLAFPNDYLGDILAENSFGRRSGFYPTPMNVCEMMATMQMHDEGDMRSKTVCDPAVGTGRMLLAASNHSYRLYGMDINNTVCKACLVNGYLYAPWMVRPFPEEYFTPAKLSETVSVEPHGRELAAPFEPFPFATEPDKPPQEPIEKKQPQMEMELA